MEQEKKENFLRLKYEYMVKFGNINLSEFVLLSYIASFNSCKIYHTNEQLSCLLKCDKRSVVNYLKHLKKLNYILINDEKKKSRSISLTSNIKVKLHFYKKEKDESE